MKTMTESEHRQYVADLTETRRRTAEAEAESAELRLRNAELHEQIADLVLAKARADQIPAPDSNAR